jgi:hypothetical protein
VQGVGERLIARNRAQLGPVASHAR